MPGGLYGPEPLPSHFSCLWASVWFCLYVLLVTSLKWRWVLHKPAHERYFILYGARSCFWMKQFLCEVEGGSSKKYNRMSYAEGKILLKSLWCVQFMIPILYFLSKKQVWANEMVAVGTKISTYDLEAQPRFNMLVGYIVRFPQYP